MDVSRKPWKTTGSMGKSMVFSRSIAVASIHGSNGWEDLGKPWDFPRQVDGIPLGDADGDGLGEFGELSGRFESFGNVQLKGQMWMSSSIFCC